MNDFLSKDELAKTFDALRGFFGSHKAAAEYLGVSYCQYNKWRYNGIVPLRSRRLLELAAMQVAQNTARQEAPRSK